MSCRHPQNWMFSYIAYSTVIRMTDPQPRLHTHTHTSFNGPLSGTTQVSRYQKGKTNLDFSKARDSEWQWHQLGHMQCKSAPHSSQITMPAPHHSVFLQAGCPFCRPTNSVKALKAQPRLIQRKFVQFEHVVLEICVWPDIQTR